MKTGFEFTDCLCETLKVGALCLLKYVCVEGGH